MIERLNHTTVFVLDQDESLIFYRDKLGFEVRTDATMGNGFRWLTVSPKTQPDLEIALMKIEEGPMCDAERAATLTKLVKDGAFCVGVFETSDCRSTYAELTATRSRVHGRLPKRSSTASKPSARTTRATGSACRNRSSRNERCAFAPGRRQNQGDR